ncbi:hypothetical protein H5410_048773 [Solanum commersonii]|uniref:Uncharacterized protein n=1 Tax=Solanum commersonii TaxID=4109 RepID=A0A9J5XJ56_SOLCO|nr:hypothetical protein H5410_048773 [Solanum commersonii]
MGDEVVSGGNEEVVSGGEEVVSGCEEFVSAGDEVVEVVSGDALSSENLKAVVTSVKNFRWIMPWDENSPSRASMGDEVVSLFLRTWTLSSEKLKAVVTSVKNFRWIMPWDPRRFREGGLIVGMDMSLWYVFGSIPPISIIIGIMLFLGDPTVNKWLLIPDTILMFLGGMFAHPVLLASIIYWYRDMPFRLIGAKAKFKLEVIPMIIAAAFHHLLEFNYVYFCLILGFTTYFYTIAHFMRAAYDIGGKDVLLGLVMLVLAYFLKGGLLVRGLGLSLCVVLCFYRYVTYSAPEVPENGKKELERLPC